MSSDEPIKIKAIIMLEIIGKPPEYLVETLENLIKQLGEEKGVSVISKDIKEPAPMKENIDIIKPGSEPQAKPKENFYTTFAEVEVEVDEISSFAYLIFKYMPAHIDIISPELIALTNNGWNEIFNELARRLHSFDEVARVLQVEKEILGRKLKELMGKGDKEEGSE